MNCEMCRIGRYRSTTLSYLRPAERQMIIISNAPAYVCDVCKHSHFDPYFLDALDFVLTRLTPHDLANPSIRQQPAPAASVTESLLAV